jgi:hypothetical protein
MPEPVAYVLVILIILAGWALVGGRWLAPRRVTRSPEMAELNRTITKWEWKHRHLDWLTQQERLIDDLPLPEDSRTRIKANVLRDRERTLAEMHQMEADLRGTV